MFIPFFIYGINFFSKKKKRKQKEKEKKQERRLIFTKLCS